MPRSIYCSRCKLEKEENRKNQSYCQKCRTETRLEKLKDVVKVEKKNVEKPYKARRPYGSGPNPICPDCGETKQNIKQTYCNPCRNIRNKKWTLETGRVKSHQTGLCKCGAERAKNQFYCKRCKALSAKEYRATGGTAVQKKYQREWMRENREKIRERFKSDPIFKLKIVSRRITNQAIKAGILEKQPCEICGSMERIEAHHDDYTKPLDIRWLCKMHHDEHHGRVVK